MKVNIKLDVIGKKRDRQDFQQQFLVTNEDQKESDSFVSKFEDDDVSSSSEEEDDNLKDNQACIDEVMNLNSLLKNNTDRKSG